MDKNSESFLESTLQLLCKSKITEYEKIEDSVIGFSYLVLPKSTKSLSLNFIKRTYQIKDELSLILIGHLYIERFLDEILNNKLENYIILEKAGVLNSFYKKVMFLKSERFISDVIADDILIVNQIRNKYAHQLNYNLNEFDFYKFSFMKKYKGKFKVKSKRNIRILYRVILRLLFFSLIDSLSNRYKFLFLLNDK